MSPGVGRRPVLLTGLAAMTAPALVACGSDDGATAGDSPSAESSTAGSSGLASVDEVPVGGAVSATTADEKPVIVAQPSAGEFVAFTAVCTHKGCTVAPEGAELKCPCHGSVFDALTGENVSGPAPSPLDSVPVKVEGDQVVEA